MRINKTKVKINKKDLRAIQLTQLEMLIEIDRICKEHGIKYCIIAGTTLGAVRHGGFIPWDDDADVAMLRDDYNRFRKVVSQAIDEDKFLFQDHSNTPYYRWGYGKIRRKHTEFNRTGQNHLKYHQGIFVDVFPLDNVPMNKYLRAIHNFVCYIVRKLQWSEVGAFNEKYRFKKIIYSIMRHVPREIVFKLYDILVKVSNQKQSELVRILTFPTPASRKYGYYKKWYTDLRNIKFEGYLFPTAKDYKGYLTYKFGNYMKLPRPDNRKGHAVSSYKIIESDERIISSELKDDIYEEN